MKCPASGESERNYWANLERLNREKDEVKFVLADLNDWNFAREIIEKYDLENRTKEILISPIFGIENLAKIAETVAKSELKVRLNLQLHKYIWGKDVHGVELFKCRCFENKSIIQKRQRRHPAGNERSFGAKTNLPGDDAGKMPAFRSDYQYVQKNLFIIIVAISIQTTFGQKPNSVKTAAPALRRANSK